MAKTTKRVTFTLTKETNDKLIQVATHLGITKSAIASLILDQSLNDILHLISDPNQDFVPKSEDGLKRLRGRSEELIQLRLGQYRRGQDDLFRNT